MQIKIGGSMKKFKRAFCTDTRLMGAMMLVVEWIGGNHDANGGVVGRT